MTLVTLAAGCQGDVRAGICLLIFDARKAEQLMEIIGVYNFKGDFERMAARRAPIESYAPASPAAEFYRSLWREIDERLTTLSSARAARARSGSTAVAPTDVASETDLVGSPWSAGTP